MSPISVERAPFLLSIMVVLLLGLVTWGAWRARGRQRSSAFGAVRDDVLVWLLVLAAFAVGAFLTYLLWRP